MISSVDQGITAPTSARHRRPVSIMPTTMAMHPEPADHFMHAPTGHGQDSHASGPERAPSTPVQESDLEELEAAVKETPPRPGSASFNGHMRSPSEPRALGEVMEEDQRSFSSDSPPLRHPRGRLEDKLGRSRTGEDSHDVLDSQPASSSPLDKAIADGGADWPLPNGSSVGVPAARIPESYSGVGSDESPRSPLRKPHKRISSRSLGGSASKSLQHALRDVSPLAREDHVADEQPNGFAASSDGDFSEKKAELLAGIDHAGAPHNALSHLRGDAETKAKELDGAFGTDGEALAGPGENGDRQLGKASAEDGDGANPGQLVYENYHSRSGSNLTSIKPGGDYKAAMAQKEDKQITSEPSAKRPSDQLLRARRDSTLVSGRHAGAGWSRSAIRWAPLNVPVQRRLQTFMVLAHSLSIVGGLALFFMLCAIPLLWPLLVPYVIYVLLSPAAVDGKLAHRTEWLRRLKIWSLFASYFPARLHRTVPLEPNRKYVFGYHPHGIISHGAFAAFGTEALGFSQLFPGITNTLLTLDSNFRVPLYRDWALRLGLASVSRESCDNILSRGGLNGEGMGRAITIVVGGARESLECRPGTLNLVLAKRKGFIKLAVRNGADLVPVLAFGENDIYEQVDAAEHPWIHKMQLIIKKSMGFTLPLFHARGKSGGNLFFSHNHVQRCSM